MPRACAAELSERHNTLSMMHMCWHALSPATPYSSRQQQWWQWMVRHEMATTLTQLEVNVHVACKLCKQKSQPPLDKMQCAEEQASKYTSSARPSNLFAFNLEGIAKRTAKTWCQGCCIAVTTELAAGNLTQGK